MFDVRTHNNSVYDKKEYLYIYLFIYVVLVYLYYLSYSMYQISVQKSQSRKSVTTHFWANKCHHNNNNNKKSTTRKPLYRQDVREFKFEIDDLCNFLCK